MNFIIRRKVWEEESIKGIKKLSKNAFGLFATGDALPEADVAFRWGCTAALGGKAKMVVNSAEAIHLVANKPRMRSVLAREDLCPETWTSLNDLVDALVDGLTERGEWVVRPKQHARGGEMKVVTTAKELRDCVGKFGEGSYITRKVNKVKEYRVLIVQGRVVQVVEKVPNNRARFNWGIGQFVNVRWGDWKLPIIDKVLAAHKLSGIDFSAVDVIVDDNDKAYVLELNSAPELIGEYSQGVFSKAFDYIVEKKSKEAIPVEEKASWKNYIHPALSREAA